MSFRGQDVVSAGPKTEQIMNKNQPYSEFKDKLDVVIYPTDQDDNITID